MALTQAMDTSTFGPARRTLAASRSSGTSPQTIRTGANAPAAAATIAFYLRFVLVIDGFSDGWSDNIEGWLSKANLFSRALGI